MEAREGQQPVFSICVPSYNRGKKALNLARTLLPEMADDWELLILDNASEKETEGYRELAAMAETEPRLRYIRHTKNCFFHGNYLACFRTAAAPHFMVLSDEDFANPVMIRAILPFLRDNPDIGILRGSIEALDGRKARNTIAQPDTVLEKGENALFGFSLTNNYVSGTIYNRELFARHGLIDRLEKGLEKNRVYPHLYMELLGCAVSRVATTSAVSCFEGEEQLTSGGDPILGHTEGPMDYAAPYSYGSRIDQFIILRDSLREAVGLVRQPFDHALFVNLYLTLCNKYFYLISLVNSRLYMKNRIHPGMLQKSFLYACAAAISMYPELEKANDEIFAKITEIYAKFELFKEQQ